MWGWLFHRHVTHSARLCDLINLGWLFYWHVTHSAKLMWYHLLMWSHWCCVVISETCHAVLGCMISLKLGACYFTDMSRTVSGCHLTDAGFRKRFCVCCFLTFLSICHAQCWAVLFDWWWILLFCFVSLFRFSQTCHSFCWAVQSHCSFCCCCFTDMSRTVLCCTLSLFLFFFFFFLQRCHAQCWPLQYYSFFSSFFSFSFSFLLFLSFFLFYRHVTHSAGLYNLTAPVFFSSCFFYRHVTHSAGLYNLTAPVFFLPFFFTDMSRTVLGCSIAAAAVMLACLISLMCGVWPARCDPLKKPRLYLATSILLLLASESSASLPFCSRRYPSARKTPYTLHSVLDVFRTFPFKLFQLVTWASEWRWPSHVILRKIVKRFFHLRLCPSGDRWRDLLGFVPAGSVSSSSTPRIFRDALSHLWWLIRICLQQLVLPVICVSVCSLISCCIFHIYSVYFVLFVVDMFTY